MDDPEDVAIEDLGREPEVEADLAPPEPASFDPDADPVDGDVEPSSTGSGGEYAGNRTDVPAATTRSGRVTRPPAYLNYYCPKRLPLYGPRVYPNTILRPFG